MAYDFTDKIAVVTGGCKGIGRFVVISLIQAGARVVFADIDACPRTLELFKTYGEDILYIETDVTDAESVRNLLKKTLKRHGRLDMAVNNAGVYNYSAPTHEWKEEQWDRMMNINLKGVWLCMKYELPPMIEQGSGAIVNVASVAGLVGINHMAGYTASKHGVVGLTKTAALDYAEQNIRINAVCPGSLSRPSMRFPKVFTEKKEDDGRHAMRRFCTGEEVAEAVMWLCSDASSFVTGHALTVDGGWSAR